jgi:hypothetical protein
VSKDDSHRFVWLRKQLQKLEEAGDIEGNTVPQIREMIVDQVPIGDIQAWSRPALGNAISGWLKDEGYRKNHLEADQEDDDPENPEDATPRGLPTKQLELFTEEELLALVSHRSGQASSLRSTTYSDVKTWLAAHPECKSTVEELLRKGGWA